jgi:hypothetical protein
MTISATMPPGRVARRRIGPEDIKPIEIEGETSASRRKYRKNKLRRFPAVKKGC